MHFVHSVISSSVIFVESELKKISTTYLLQKVILLISSLCLPS